LVPTGRQDPFHGEVNNGIWSISPDGRMTMLQNGGYPGSPDGRKRHVDLAIWHLGNGRGWEQQEQQ
jgi:hypothetical protein